MLLVIKNAHNVVDIIEGQKQNSYHTATSIVGVVVQKCGDLLRISVKIPKGYEEEFNKLSKEKKKELKEKISSRMEPIIAEELKMIR